MWRNRDGGIGGCDYFYQDVIIYNFSITVAQVIMRFSIKTLFNNCHKYIP